MREPHDIRDKRHAKTLNVTAGKVEFQQVDFAFIKRARCFRIFH